MFQYLAAMTNGGALPPYRNCTDGYVDCHREITDLAASMQGNHLPFQQQRHLRRAPAQHPRPNTPGPLPANIPVHMASPADNRRRAPANTPATEEREEDTPWPTPDSA